MSAAEWKKATKPFDPKAARRQLDQMRKAVENGAMDSKPLVIKCRPEYYEKIKEIYGG